MSRLLRPLALLAVLIASGGLSACGTHHDEEARVQHIEGEGFYLSLGDLNLVLESMAPDFDHASRHHFSYTLPRRENYGGVFGQDFTRAFFRAALEGSPPPVTSHDALRVLQIIEAAYESSATGRTVDLSK